MAQRHSSGHDPHADDVRGAIGGSIAARSGIVIIPARGWPGMFLIAVLPLIVLVPLGINCLPDVRTVAAQARAPASAPSCAPRTW